jgi:hypothetical protein
MLSPYLFCVFSCLIIVTFVVNNWGEAKSIPRSAAAKLSSLEFVGWVGWVAMQRMHSMSMYVCVTYWCGQRIGSAKIKGQHAAALHLIHRAAHTEQSAQRSFCFSTDARIRMCICAASGNRNCIDTHSLMHLLQCRHINTLTCKRIWSTVGCICSLETVQETNFWEFSNCIYVLWSSFFCYCSGARWRILKAIRIPFTLIIPLFNSCRVFVRVHAVHLVTWWCC